MKLVVGFQRFGPYHVARLNAASQNGSLIGLEFSAIDQTYSWSKWTSPTQFERRVLFPHHDVGTRSAHAIKLRVNEVLRQINPDVIAVPGWSSRPALALIDWGVRNNKSLVLMSDSTEGDFERSVWKERIKRSIVSLFSSALVAGKRHIDYTNKLGMPLEKIFTGFDVVDNNYFSQSAHSVRENEVEARHVLGISRKFFLVPCRFIPEKNLAMLAVAYEKYRRDLSSSGWDLVLVGDGPDRADIVALCRKVSISQYVHFVGFKQYNELPIFFGLASALILPSLKDTWGLVVNEAMASGLPVLVSSHCGCAPDLVSEGINGFTFDPTNSDALASLMHRLTVEGVDLKVMGDAGREIISEWGLERFSSGLWNAAVTACCSNRRRSNTFGRFLVRGAVIL